MKYATIVADPPWYYENAMAGNAKVDGFKHRPFPYPTMTVEEISRLRVADLAATDAHLYLWATNRYLRDAYDVAAAWGFAVSTPLVWCKGSAGWQPGGAFYSNAEFLLFARRGSLRAKTRIRHQWFQWPRREHSRKPEASFFMIERVSPGPYLELFARQHRAGWESWGDQVVTLDEDVAQAMAAA